jgi:hypothetical protein
MKRAPAGAGVATTRAALMLVLAALLAGCGGSGSGEGVSVPKVQPAAQFTLANFTPASPVQPGRPVAISFTIMKPDGRPLTSFRTGSGPHTGVHLIIVRDDLAYIIHEHPPPEPSGVFTQNVTFPAPGPYRVLVDIYPKLPGVLPNFQLFGTVHVAGAYHEVKLPPFKPDVDVDGYHFDIVGHPSVHAIQAQFLHVNVTTPQGTPVNFVPWFGALAHAIFFHAGSLDYFHTHICAPNAPNCGSLSGVPVTRVTGHATPGKLTVGVLLAVPGTWRLFLQMRQGNKIITAPYTLDVK